MATARDVAEWMVTQVSAGIRLYQKRSVRLIRANFGEEFSYENENRNLAISKEVLDEFEKLAPADKVKWVLGKRYWRLAREGDPEGRSVKR